MPRYFFHLVDGDDVTYDPEGDELPNIVSARAQAVLSAREILAEAIKLGAQRLPRFVVVISESADEVAVIDVKTIVPSSLNW